MKKAFFLLVLSLGTSIYAQEIANKNTIENNISEIPNYSELVKKKINLKDVVTSADKAPEFPGGFEVFKQKYFEGMPTVNLKQNQKLDTRIYFVVEKDGYVRNIAAIGSDKKHVEAAELGVKRIFTRWKPAMIGDKPVRYLYTFPLSSRKF